MPEEISRITDFLWSVVTNWLVLAGGAVMVILGIIERLRQRDVHLKIYRNILVSLLFIAFYMSWRDAKIQLEQAPDSSPRIKVDVADAEGRKNLQETQAKLEKAEAIIQNLKSAAEADMEYRDIAMLNMIGKPQVDGDIIYTTAISKALEGAYVVEGIKVTYKTDSTAEQKFRDTIAVDARFPFSYVGLGVILHDRNDNSWRELLTKAEEIFKKTTVIPGHHPNHDLFLKKVRDMLTSKEITQP